MTNPISKPERQCIVCVSFKLMNPAFGKCKKQTQEMMVHKFFGCDKFKEK